MNKILELADAYAEAMGGDAFGWLASNHAIQKFYTLANGEVVSWPEPVRGALEYDTMYYFVKGGEVVQCEWDNHRLDKARLAAVVIHLTREAAQEHADALLKINCQEVV